MKYLLVNQTDLGHEGRWDADYHLPALEIRKFHVRFEELSRQQLMNYSKAYGLNIKSSIGDKKLRETLQLKRPDYNSIDREHLELILETHDEEIPEEITEIIDKIYSLSLNKVSDVADLVKDKRDPQTSQNSETQPRFTYTSISDVNVDTGEITDSQSIFREEAPSRARQVAKAGDIIISTTRPTRGCIAVVPDELDDTIFSTGFCIIRPKENIDSNVLKFLLRLPSTAEQFRKWSAGVSYPAILPADVMKTQIPRLSSNIQKAISKPLTTAIDNRNETIKQALDEFDSECQNFKSLLTYGDVQNT